MLFRSRTLGYGKAGEFADPKGWELQTATIAEREGITKNVTAGDFGAPAPRQMVAEILFRGLLTETVEYSALIAGGYTKSGETLGKREFGLESVEGIIVANEWANLDDGEDVMSEGKTALRTEDKDYTLDITTPITDIGENFAAYIAKSKVLTIENTGNTVWEPENGKGTDISSNAKFEKETGMKKNSDTEYFINFEGVYESQSEWLIRYRVNAADIAGTWMQDYLENVIGLVADADGNYVRSFQPKTEIPQNDITIMRSIFYTADRTQDNPDNADVSGFVRGEVYAGTSSMKDLSDIISWDEFVKTYLQPVDITDITESENGDWLKVIDNDGDGVADYVFYTWYWLDEVVSTYKNKAGDTVMQYYGFDDDDDRFEDKIPTIYMEGTDRAERDVEVGTVVLAAQIDNQILVSKANNVTKTVEKYAFKTDEITTTDGETYGQSFIGNWTPMQQNLTAMDEKTEYLMHLDHFGYVRAYELPGGTKYALVTELYYTNTQNGNLQQNWPMNVELTIGEEDTREYNLSNASSNAFIALDNWTAISNRVITANYENWLQPAIEHLGVASFNGNPGVDREIPNFSDNYSSSNWPKNQLLVHDFRGAAPLNGSTEFNYGTEDVPVVSYTNVAVVSVDGDDATIQTAAQRKLDQNGRWITDPNSGISYDVDYIQLSTADIDAKSVRYAIGGDAAYQAANNYYVNAVHDTEYYIAYNGGVYYAKDYVNFPGLKEEDHAIRAAYAVARDTSADNADKPYWVADVIVYEVVNWDDSAKSNIALAYYDRSRTTGQTYMLNTLNNKTEDPMIDVVPENVNWWGEYAGWGFYDLYNTSINEEDGTMTARKLEPITEDFSDNGIYAGVITREVYVANGGAYIDVNIYGGTNSDGTLATDASIRLENNIYSITADQLSTSGNIFNEAEPLQYSATGWSQVLAGDRVVWVGEAKGTGVSSASFIVDLSHGEDPNSRYDNDIYYNTAAFLGYHGNVPAAGGNWNPDPLNPTAGAVGVNVTPAGALWRVIMDEQLASTIAVWNIEYTVVDESGNPVALAAGDSITPATQLKSKSDKAVEVVATINGYDVTAMTVTKTNSKGEKVADCYLTDGKWYLNNFTDDVEVTITVSAEVLKYGVTLKGTGLPAGTTVEEPYYISSTGSMTFDLTKAPFAVPGYKITNATDNATTPTNAILTATPTPGTLVTQLVVTTPTAAGVVDLTYAPVDTSVTATLTNMPTVSFATIPAGDTTNNTEVTGANVVSGTAFASTLKYGGKVTLNWTGAANTTYAVTASANCTTEWKSEAVGGSYSLEVTTDGSATLTIVGTVQPNVGITTDVTAATGATVTLPNGDALPGSILLTGDPEDLEFKVTAGSDTRITKVEYQVIGSAAEEADVVDAAAGTYKIPAGAFEAAGNITIIVTAVSTETAEVTLKTTGASDPAKPTYYSVKKYGSNDWSQPELMDSTGDAVNLAIGDQVKFTSGASVTAAAASGTTVAETGAELSGLTVIVTITATGTGTGTITLSDTPAP